MSQENNQKYVLFFSEYCDYCKELLGEIKKFQLEAIFNFFNVDIQRNKLPNFVTEVPCVFLPEFNHVLTGEEVFGLLNHMKKELGLVKNEPPQMQQQPSPQMQQPPPNNSDFNQMVQSGMQPHPSENQNMRPNQNEPPQRMIPQNTGPQQNSNKEPPAAAAPPQSEPGELEGYNICEMGMCSDSYSYLDDDKMIQHNFELISGSENVPQNIPQQASQDSDPRKGSTKEQKISDTKYQDYIRNRNETTPQPIERH
jgi:hypothetical protein